MNWFLARLAEPSTHAALAALAGSIAASTTGPTQAAAMTVAVLFGGAGVVTSEKK